MKITDKFYNNTLMLSMALIVPVGILAPLGLWIPLMLTGIIFFTDPRVRYNIFRKRGFVFILVILFLALSLLSLLWNENKLFSLFNILKFFTLIISILSFIEIVNLNKENVKTKYFLFASISISAFFLIIDLYFNMAIKPWLAYCFDILVGDKSDAKILSWNAYFWKYYIDGVMGGASGHYNRGISILLIFFPIAAALIWNNKKLVCIVLILSSIAIILGPSKTAILAIILNLAVFFMTVTIKKYAIYFFACITFFYVFFAPFFLVNKNFETYTKKEGEFYDIQAKAANNRNFIQTQELTLVDKIFLFKITMDQYSIKEFMLLKINNLKLNFVHREAIWSYTRSKIEKRPIAGYGFASSRFIDKGFRIKNNLGRDVTLIPLHPHNNIMQIWLELGFLGAILLASMYVFIWIKILKIVHICKYKAGLLSASFSSVLLIGQSSYGLWQNWWLASLGFCIIFSLLVFKAKDNESTI